jgi:hypothetical protein
MKKLLYKDLIQTAIGIYIIFLFPPVTIIAQTQMSSETIENGKVDCPEVPRVSAYQASVKLRNGEAILIHAGGEAYERRHIFGALDLGRYKDIPVESVINGHVRLPKISDGIELFTYCY